MNLTKPSDTDLADTIAQREAERRDAELRLQQRRQWPADWPLSERWPPTVMVEHDNHDAETDPERPAPVMGAMLVAAGAFIALLAIAVVLW